MLRFLVLLAVVMLAIIKLAGLAAISWWVVFLPLIAWVILVLAVIGVVLVSGLICAAVAAAFGR